jgi:hypothetical protein
MSPFETYQAYLGLKNHFSNPKYDYFKYKKTRATLASFNRRSDKYWFEKTSRKYNDKEIVEFLVANFVEIINSGERTYQEWMRRQQSLTYLFKEQSTELFSQTKLENVFDCSKGHPILLKAFLKSELAPEIMVIYDKIFSYISEFDKKLLDPVWETVSLKIRKYNPFINIDVFQFKKILRDIINE